MSQKSSKASYRVSLEPRVLKRAGLILGLLLLTFTILTAGGIYQGAVSGDFDKVLLKPFRDFGADFVKALNASPSPRPDLTASSPSPSAAISLTAKPVSAPPQKKSQPVPTLYPYKTYGQIKKEQDEWWANVQEQNRRLSQQSQKELEQFRQQSQQNLKQFEAQGQTGLEQFRQESEKKMEEFRQKYGI